MRHTPDIRLFGVLSVALLFLSACTQKVETPATQSV